MSLLPLPPDQGRHSSRSIPHPKTAATAQGTRPRGGRSLGPTAAGGGGALWRGPHLSSPSPGGHTPRPKRPRRPHPPADTGIPALPRGRQAEPPQGGGRYPRGGDWGGRGPGCAPGRAGRASWRRGGSGAGRRCLGLCALQPGAEEEEEAEEEKEAAAVGPGRGERGAADPGGWQRTRRRLRKAAGRPGLQQQRAASDWPGCRRG